MADDKDTRRFALPAGIAAVFPKPVEPATMNNVSYFHTKPNKTSLWLSAVSGLDDNGGELQDARILPAVLVERTQGKIIKDVPITDPRRLKKGETPFIRLGGAGGLKVEDVEPGSAAFVFRIAQKNDAERKKLTLAGFAADAKVKIISQNEGLIKFKGRDRSYIPAGNDLVVVIIPPDQHSMEAVNQRLLASDLQIIKHNVTKKDNATGRLAYFRLPKESKEELKTLSDATEKLIKKQQAAEVLAKKNKQPLPPAVFTVEEIKIFETLKKKLGDLVQKDPAEKKKPAEPKKNPMEALLQANDFTPPDLRVAQSEPALKFDSLVGTLKMRNLSAKR